MKKPLDFFFAVGGGAQWDIVSQFLYYHFMISLGIVKMTLMASWNLIVVIGQ